MLEELKLIKGDYDSELSSSVPKGFLNLFKEAFLTVGFINIICGILFIFLFILTGYLLHKSLFGNNLLKRKLNKIEKRISTINSILDNSILDSSISVKGNMKSISIEKFDKLKKEKRNLLESKNVIDTKYSSENDYNNVVDKILAFTTLVIVTVIFIFGVNVLGSQQIKGDLLDKYELKSMEVYEDYVANYPINKMNVLRLRKTGTNEYHLIYVNGAGIVREMTYTGKIVVSDSVNEVLYEFKYFPPKSDYKDTLLNDSENLTHGVQGAVIKVGKNHAYVLDGVSQYINTDVINKAK